MISRRRLTSAVAFACLFSVSSTASAERIGGIEFPKGAVSFADRVVSTQFDNATNLETNDCENALGTPDDAVCALGNAEDGDVNELIVEFTDNFLVDAPGDDLYIFETGMTPEAFEVAISIDGQEWFDLGEFGGATLGIDLSTVSGLPENALFTFVRLRDVPDGVTSAMPAGPDIDAIGAIGTVEANDLVGDICSVDGESFEVESVTFPHGSLAFADHAAVYSPGAGVEGEAREPTRGIGGPDGDTVSLGATSNGIGPGSISFFFADNVLVDDAGPDLYVFGQELSGTQVEVSVDGLTWFDVGVLQDGRALDLGLSEADLPSRGFFRFVRFTASRDVLNVIWPDSGPDIDAVGALSSCDPLQTADTDNDGVADALGMQERDFDSDGVSDSVDVCPADPNIAQTEPLSGNQVCGWPGAPAPSLIIQDEEGCTTAGGRSSVGWIVLLGFGLMGLRRRRIGKSE